MGISQSNNNNRRRNHAYYYAYNHPSSYSYYDTPYHTHPPPPPPPPPFPFQPHLLPPPPPSYSYPTTCNNCTNPVLGRSFFAPYHNSTDWSGSGSYLPPQPQAQVVGGLVTPPTSSPYAETQQAKKVRSGVNVHKDSLKLELDELNPHHHLVSFVFDALFDGNAKAFGVSKSSPMCKK